MSINYKLLLDKEHIKAFQDSFFLPTKKKVKKEKREKLIPGGIIPDLLGGVINLLNFGGVMNNKMEGISKIEVKVSKLKQVKTKNKGKSKIYLRKSDRLTLKEHQDRGFFIDEGGTQLSFEPIIEESDELSSDGSTDEEDGIHSGAKDKFDFDD